MRSQFNQILAKLTTKVAIQKAQVVSNPIPYLEKAGEELVRAQVCFDEIDRALSPDCVFEYGINNKIDPNYISGVDYI